MHQGDTDAFIFGPGRLDAVALPGGVRQPMRLILDPRLRPAAASRRERRSSAARVDTALSVHVLMTGAYQVLGALVAFVVVTFPLLLIGYLLFG